MRIKSLLRLLVMGVLPLAFVNPALAQASSDDEAIEEIVTTGVRYSLTQAVEVKRMSMQIMDALVAEDIGKFPDANVVESMQRIPGVQVTNRGGGEVSTVSIRGLGDVTTTVNGRNIFTTSGRSVALADIPSTLINRVYKSRSPENISRGIAGGINIHTFRPFDFEGFKVSAQARAIYQEQSEKTDPNLSFLVSDRWDTASGEFGALLNVSRAQTNWLDQGVHAGASFPYRLPDDPLGPLARINAAEGVWEAGTDLGLPFAAGSVLDDGTLYLHARDAVFQPHVGGERERPAWNLSLQWAPNDTSEYVFEAFYNGYRNTQHNSLFFTFVDAWGDFDPNDPIEIYPGTNVVKSRYINYPYTFISGDVLVQQTDSYMYSLAGNWDVGDKLVLQSEIVFQDSEYEDDFFAMRMDNVFPRLFVDINTGQGVPFIGFYDDPNTPENEADLTDASLWNFAELYDNGALDKGDAFTWTVDGDMDVEWGMIHTFSFGLRYDDRGAEENSYFGPDRHCNAAVGCAGLTPADFPGLMGITRNHFDGQATVLTEWAIPSQHGLLSNQEAIRSAWGYPAGNEKVWENEFNITEKKTELYAQADFSTETASGFVDGRFGFRWLDQETDMSFVDPNGDIAGAKNSNTVILPSLMVRWGITEDLIARFGYTETFNLPTFSQLNPFIQYNPDVTNIGYGTANGGNANLKPIDSANIDLSLEWYFAPGSVVYGTYFIRDISNAIVDYRNVVQYNDPDDDPDRGLYDYVLSQPDNAGDSKLNGWEFGTTWFPVLEGWWDGLGVQASMTLLDSQRDIPVLNDDGSVERIDKLDIFGVSDLSYSVMLAYDRDLFSARLSYFWRDKFLDRNEARFFANPVGIYKSAEESLDFQATWHVNDNWTLTFDAVNLTDPVFHENYGDNPKIFNFYNLYYSRSFALGVRYQF